jgi:hypothetical protein
MKCLKQHKDIKFHLVRLPSTNLKYLREFEVLAVDAEFGRSYIAINPETIAKCCELLSRNRRKTPKLMQNQLKNE